MTNKVFTIVTFAPVQGFIENSRKLRDLYGSSFIISCLSRTICDAAKEDKYHVVSPAIYKLTQGTPNQIIIEGETAFTSEKAEKAFQTTWQKMVKACRLYIEDQLPNYDYHWQRNWNAWANYTWEFFCVEGEPRDSITDIRQKLNEIKRRRNWIGINWVGESSTLSGSDAVAWYGMTDQMNPKNAKMGEIDKKIKDFYEDLSNNLIDTIIDETEQLSIPELVKRLVTLYPVKRELKELGVNVIELPEKFTDLNRKTKEENRWTGWFQGDGDSIGKYFKSLIQQGKNESESLKEFSEAMIEWGQEFENRLPAKKEVRAINSDKKPPEGRIIYAGGDDFLGVLYRNENPPLTLDECLPWLYHFPNIWNEHEQPITVSMGFVWAAGGVPQRDILQHCKLAEQSAKKQGRDRLVIRILYSSGNYLEWGCPWWWFEELLESYRDRDGDSIKSLKNSPKSYKHTPNWTHFYNDVLALESRHAFGSLHDAPIDIALEIFEIYFGKENRIKLENSEYWWNKPKENYLWNNEHGTKTMGKETETGILGEKEAYYKEMKKNDDEQQEFDLQEINKAINNWVINLAKVGLKIFQSSNNKSLPDLPTEKCA